MPKRQVKTARTMGSGRNPPSPAKPKNVGGDKRAGEEEAYEQKKEMVAQLRRMGYSFRLIAEHPMVQLSKSATHKIFHKILDEGVIKRRSEHVEMWREEKLEELRQLKQHVYETMIRSKNPGQEELEEHVEGGGKAGKGKTLPRIKKTIKKRLRDGSVDAQRLLLDIIDKECLLLGIIKPDENVQQNVAQVNFFLPVTRRNRKEANAEYTIPKPKETTGIVINTRPPPSELAIVERAPAIEGSEEAK
jgi:hypothetical protein